MNRRMNRKQRAAMLIFLPTLLLGNMYLGNFSVSIGIGLIFIILVWLVRDRDAVPPKN